MASNGAKRSASMSRNKPPSRPTTPLRPGSRTSLRDSQGFSAGGSSSEFPLDALEPGLAELSDSMADLEANFMHLQLMHESLSRFNESFASFLYGLNMNAFCVDFPEAPVPESHKRAARNEEASGTGPCSENLIGHLLKRTELSAEREKYRQEGEGETTFMTVDTSYISSLPTASSRYTTPGATSRPSSVFSRRGGGENTTGTVRRGSVRGTGTGRRGSGLARAKPRGAR